MTSDPIAEGRRDPAPDAARAVAGAPAQQWPPELLLRAQGRGRGMRAALFDVDGVLTDGRLYYGESGEMLKAFHVHDGHGLKLLASQGIVPVVISGRDSPPLRRRLADLGLAQVHLGVADKLGAAGALLGTLGIDWDEVAVIGDDWPDLPLLARAGLACAPADAHVEALALAHHVTRRRGGEGAAREFCDLLLAAAGRYALLYRQQQATLDDGRPPAPAAAAPPGTR